MRLSIHLDNLPEEEALKLINGQVSERVRSICRKALLRAREEHKISARVSFHELTDGSFEVRDNDDIIGIARHYARYWQIYVRRSQTNIRRSTWPLLQQAIRDEVLDND